MTPVDSERARTMAWALVVSLAVAGGATAALWILLHEECPREPVDALPPVTALVVDPEREGALHAATAGGVLRSVDEGASWTRVGPAWNVTAFALHPYRDAVMAASGHDDGAGGGVRLSSDGGCRWEATTLTRGAVSSLAWTPLAQERLWAWDGDRVHTSVTGGATWSALPVDAPVGVRFLAAHPFEKAGVYAVTASAVVVTVDGGATWRPFHNGTVAAFEPFRHHPDHFWLVNGTGVHRSTDHGGNWTRLLDTGGDEVARLALHPHSHRVAYALTESGRLLRTEDEGASWAQVWPPEG